MTTERGATSQMDADEIQREALVLFAGRPSVLEAFYDLTDKGSLNLQWNPMNDPSEWEFDGKPNDEDIRFLAAVRTLLDREYIINVTHNGRSDYTVTASGEAEAVRRALDELPDSLKGQVKKELEHSRA